MVKGGYLRTNWRQTGQKLEMDAVGRGLAQGSFMRAGSGFDSPVIGGGLIYHKLSVVGEAVVALNRAVYTIGAATILNSVFGANNFGEGWKIQPFGVWPRILSGTAGGDTSIFNMVWSLTTSDDSTIKWYAQLVCLTADPYASYFSCCWYWAG